MSAAPTLTQYRSMVKPEKEICRWCNTQLPQAIDTYPHIYGWPVRGMDELQWLSIHCPKCEYDWSLWKLGVPR